MSSWQGMCEGGGLGAPSYITPLTYAQATVIAAQLQDILPGEAGKGEGRYKPAYQTLQKAAQKRSVALPAWLSDIMENSPSANRPGNDCSRYTSTCILSAAMEISGTVLPELKHMTAVPDSYNPTVMSFYRAGILNRKDRCASFKGLDDINRGQAAAMLVRTIRPERRITCLKARIALKP